MDDAYCRQNRGGRKTVHSRIAICKGISSCTDMGVGLFIRNRSGRILSNVFTSFLCRTSDISRILHGSHLRADPARRSTGRCARSSIEFKNGLHEPHQQVPLLEHELPSRTPHVSISALSQPAETARTGKRILPKTL